MTKVRTFQTHFHKHLKKKIQEIAESGYRIIYTASFPTPTSWMSKNLYVIQWEEKVIPEKTDSIIPVRKQSDAPYNITCLNCRKKGYVADFTAKCDKCGVIACFTIASLNKSNCMHCETKEEKFE